MVLPGKGLSWKEFFKALMEEWNNDDLSDVAGSVTFFAVLAIFPFLIFAVALTSLFIDPKGVESVIDQLSRIAPAAVTQILGDRLRSLTSQTSVGLLTVSAIITVWSASGGVSSLINALNTCYGVKETRPFWKTKGIAILMTLFGAVFSLVAAIVAVALPPIATKLGGPLGDILLWARMPVAAALIMLLWAVMYYILPDVEQRFRFITPGSVVGVILWAVASYGFSQYVTHFGNYEVTYGALGGVIIMLFWMWISALTLLLGAEINAIIEHKSPDGKRVGAHVMADSGPDDTKTEKAEKEEHERRTYRPAREPFSVAARRKAKVAGEIAALGFLFRFLRRRSP